jgi:hypothetical protein
VNTDIKTYDAGNLFVSTYGNTNTTVIGELRVRYKCVLSVPVLESASGGSGSAGSYLLITSALTGEAAAATTVYAPLFAAATSPVLVANGIGATVATTGLITLSAGSYLVEANVTGYDSTASVTALPLNLCQVVTPDTDVVSPAATGSGSTINAASGHVDWFTSISPLIWNTAQFGLTICAQAASTYASGSAFNQGYLKITQL